MKTTPWFSCAKHKPVRKGWYEWVKYQYLAPFATMQWWDGEVWRCSIRSLPYCVGEQKMGYWRGIAK